MPEQQPEVRAPRAIVQMNGVEQPGMVSIRFDVNNFYRANTFEVCFPWFEIGKPQKFEELEKIIVKIFIGFPRDPNHYETGDLDLMFVGEVDDMDVDMLANKCRFTGRDLSARLIEEKTTEKFPNHTASQIATELAQKHGLKPVVTETEKKVGKEYEKDHVRLSDERSEWDILTYLAEQEQFILYVRGEELHFEPGSNPDSDKAIKIKWVDPDTQVGFHRANVIRLTLQRSLTLSKDVIVNVRSWNAKRKAGFTAQARSTRSRKSQQSGGTAQTYTYYVPGLDKEQALQRAQSELKQITQHELRISYEGPATNDLNETSIIKLEGVSERFDQTYFPDSIVREWSAEQGYHMEVRAKNSSPISTVLV